MFTKLLALSAVVGVFPLVASFSAPVPVDLDKQRSVSWPLKPADESHPLWATYGQFGEDDEHGMYFHEGIGIVARTEALAVETGQIVGAWNGGEDPKLGVVIMRMGNSSGWNYHHVEPGKKPVGNEPPTDGLRMWQSDDVVKAGDVLGRVFDRGMIITRLQLERGGGSDPSMSGVAGSTRPHPRAELRGLQRPIDDPLNRLRPLTDRFWPVVNKEIHFRVAEHDRNGKTTASKDMYVGQSEVARRDNQYFTQERPYFMVKCLVIGKLASTMALNSEIGTNEDRSNIDIIADIYDRVSSSAVAMNVGVRSVFFSITGDLGRSGDIQAFDFQGEFLDFRDWRSDIGWPGVPQAAGHVRAAFGIWRRFAPCTSTITTRCRRVTAGNFGTS